MTVDWKNKPHRRVVRHPQGAALSTCPTRITTSFGVPTMSANWRRGDQTLSWWIR